MEIQSIYENIVESKTGEKVPLFTGGKPANSLYNPVREAEKAFPVTPVETFAVFVGMGDGKRIKLFLDADIKNECLVIEKNRESINFLEDIQENSDLIKSKKVRLLDFDREKQDFPTILSQTYLPAIFKNFTLNILQSWKNFCPDEADWILTKTEKTLVSISRDFATQSHFGKTWFVNFTKNLFILENIQKTVGKNIFHRFLDTGKTAVIAAAGPSLEKDILYIKEKRDSLTVFSTDTAYPVLHTEGIVPDFIVSIDPQYLSARHLQGKFQPDGEQNKIPMEKPVLIMDICGNPAVAVTALKLEYPVIFAAGGHPLASYFAGLFFIPVFSTFAGTVTASALDIARRLGFSKTRILGGDFAYTGGKPYSRGTYFENQFFSISDRLSPGESLYTGLMLRTDVQKVREKNGTITYKTEILDSYRQCIETADAKPEKWKEKDYTFLPSGNFLPEFKSKLKKLLVKTESGLQDFFFLEGMEKEETRVFLAILPLMAFFRKKKPLENREKILKMTINLALNIIEGYTHII